MGKEDARIMVVERDHLFRLGDFQGFRSHVHRDYESVILNGFEIMRRGDAEENSDYKQPIAYMMVVNPGVSKVFAYRRSSEDKDYGEKRLQNKWSWGVGGHIDTRDLSGSNPIVSSSLRELREELDIEGLLKHRVLGYINDDSNNVGKVHFGILYLIEANGVVKPKDPEIAKGRMTRIEALEKACASSNFNAESWSRIALDPLKDYFSS